MNFAQINKKIIDDFGLTELPREDQNKMLLEISKTIQKQFLLDVYDILGNEKFEALQASASMGEEFYNTTLKHLLPHYEEIFQAAHKKILMAFKGDQRDDA